MTDQNGDVIASGISIITTDEVSSGGTSIESVDSIRKYSTQIYASRNRAVTAADYEAIRLKYSNDEVFDQYKPKCKKAEKLYKIAEKVRYEKIGSD